MADWLPTLAGAFALAFALVMVAAILREPEALGGGMLARLARSSLPWTLGLGTLLAAIAVLASISASLLAVYFVIWWTVLFAVLPFGARSQAEADDIVPGTEPAAPRQPFLVQKAMITTAISAVIFAIFYWVRFQSGLTLDDLPFTPEIRTL